MAAILILRIAVRKANPLPSSAKLLDDQAIAPHSVFLLVVDGICQACLNVQL